MISNIFRRGSEPDMTQRTVPALPRRIEKKHNEEHHNLASDYVYGRTNSKTQLSFDEYIRLVRAFGALAVTLRKESIDVDFLIDHATSERIIHLPASQEDFEKAYRRSDL